MGPVTWAYIALHNMTISRNSRPSYFPANVTGLWGKWNGPAVMKTPYRLALFHISHSASCWPRWGGLGSPPVSTLTPVPGLRFPICSTERNRLLDLQSSPNLDLAGIQRIYRASHGWSPFYDKNHGPKRGSSNQEGDASESELDSGPQSCWEHLKVMTDVPCSINMCPFFPCTPTESTLALTLDSTVVRGHFDSLKKSLAVPSSIKIYNGNNRKIALPPLCCYSTVSLGQSCCVSLNVK